MFVFTTEAGSAEQCKFGSVTSFWGSETLIEGVLGFFVFVSTKYFCQFLGLKVKTY